MATSASTSTKELNPAKFAQDMFRNLRQYLDSGDSISLLVAGKTGIGKSSLINSLIGCRLAKEGGGVIPVSSEIVSYSKSINTPLPGKENEVTFLTVWDSPGFGDVFVSETDQKQRLSQLKLAVEQADVLLYCFKITDRITRDDVDGIIEITKALSSGIWTKAVFLLTFANKLEIPESEKDAKTLTHYLSHKVEEWKKIICDVLEDKSNVPRDILKDISVVPVGYQKKNPPGYDDWYTPFWIELYKKTRDKGKPGLVRLTWSRLECEKDKVSDNNDRNPNDELPVKLFNSDPEKQNLPSSTHLPALTPNELPPVPPPCLRVSPPIHPVSTSNTLILQPEIPNSNTLILQPEIPEQSDDGLPVGGPRQDELCPDEVPPTRIMKAAKIGGIIGSSATAGTVVGLLIGIVGGPIGLAIGGGIGFVVGSGVGAGGLIAEQVHKSIKRKREEQTPQLGPQPRSASINS